MVAPVSAARRRRYLENATPVFSVHFSLTLSAAARYALRCLKLGPFPSRFTPRLASSSSASRSAAHSRFLRCASRLTRRASSLRSRNFWNEDAASNGSRTLCLPAPFCVMPTDTFSMKRVTCSKYGSCSRSTQWMQSTGQLLMAMSMSSSVLSHCANTRERPWSSSMRNVAGAAHTHCLHPMHVNSSTNTARVSPGLAFFVVHLLYSVPVNPSWSSSRCWLSSALYRSRESGSFRIAYASFSITHRLWPSWPDLSGWQYIAKS
mmetsp:Transcript_6305/g.16064  ORF Transcript_6305/g.16064 Transcript_6305/m.16064 type:complete len:263 (+) Transcript_6305:346-1134(+)